MADEDGKVTRRGFLGTSVATTVGAAIATSKTVPILGANDRVRTGFIGVGNRGTQLLKSFMKNQDCEVAAYCDVYEPYLYRDASLVPDSLSKEIGGNIPVMDEAVNGRVERFTDFRKMLEMKDLDAVCIATPDHWHAIQTIQACESGKDVYVEKPLTISILEGRRMVEAARSSGRVVQVGLQRRSSDAYASFRKRIGEGSIGKISSARAFRVSNMAPKGIGRCRVTTPPKGLDWDMWLGPRAWQEYQENIHPYKFRWWKNYSSQLGNWGVHYFDAIRWMIGEEAPEAVTAIGGKFAVDDDRTIPDTLEVTFRMPSGAIIVFGQYEASGVKDTILRGEVELRGTEGTAVMEDAYGEKVGYGIWPTDNGQYRRDDSKVFEERVEVFQGNMTDRHIRNFLDCVKSRDECNCSLEKGHRSTSFAHLATIALETDSVIKWDAEKEEIINNPGANSLLHYEYRKPWRL